jgi:hypothetical protein
LLCVRRDHLGRLDFLHTREYPVRHGASTDVHRGRRELVVATTLVIAETAYLLSGSSGPRLTPPSSALSPSPPSF